MLVSVTHIVIWYFCTFQNDHCDSLVIIYQHTRILYNDWLFLTLNILYLWHLFCNWQLVPLNFPHLFFSSQFSSLQAAICLFSVSVTLFLFLYVCSYFFFLISYVCYLSFSIQLTLSSTIIFRSNNTLLQTSRLHCVLWLSDSP